MMAMNSPPAVSSPSSLIATTTTTNNSSFHTLDGDLCEEDSALSIAMASVVSPCAPPPAANALRLKYMRAFSLVSSVLNKFYNGSARAVDPFVIRCLQEEETRLFSLQCFIEQGPAENCRERQESGAMFSAAKTTNAQMPLLRRLFSGICGGYMGGPGSIMREWDTLSNHDAGQEDALNEYIAIVDRILPGWDRPLPHEFPIAPHDKFWKDDTGVDQCQGCGSSFSTLQCRRHHCRLCFDIFCAICCADFVDMALCAGAPIRRQRVCAQCFEEAEKDRSLLEVRRVIRENHELEQRIKEITTATEAQLCVKKREEAKLRIEAQQCGCDLTEIDAEIDKQIGSPVSIAVKMPPAHKFTPRETVDANEQLALAHRQLLMGLKIAQTRAKKAVEKMDVTLRVLRDAICFGSASSWNVVLRQAGPLFSLRDIRVLAAVSHTMRRGLERYKCEAKCVLAQDLPAPQWRAFLWQSQWLKNDETRQYISDLAEAIRTRIDSSDSDSDGGDEYDSEGNSVETKQEPAMTVHGSVTSHALLGVHVSPLRRSVWKSVYEFILARCDDYTSASSTGEFDAQIQGDVSRTFGVSSLRQRQSGSKTNIAGHRKAYQLAGASTLETPLALRKTSLTNVLRAFASVNSEIGYCQGMDHVAAVLLSVVDWNESDAFWMLTSLVVSPQFELDKLYGPGLPHLTLRVYQLERLMAIHLPELHAHLKEMEFPVSMITTTWFMTLFTNMDTLSYDLVLRVLDGFFVSGWKFIFRMALALMEALQLHMLASSFEEMPQVLYDIHIIAPQFAGAETDVVLESVRKFKVTNSQLQRLALEFEQSGGSNISSTRSNGSIVASARSVVNATNVKTETSNGNGNTAASPTSVSAIPSIALQANGNTISRGVHHDNANVHPSPAKHRASSPAVILPSISPLEISDSVDVVPPSPPKSPISPRASRRSRSSSSSISLDGEYGHKSPDKTRAASPATFVSSPHNYTPQSLYGLATPHNANYFF